MPKKSKISPAFAPFLADRGPREKQDAIVVYQAPDEGGPALNRRISRRRLSARLQSIKEAARTQEPMRNRLIEGYMRGLDARARRSGESPFQANAIGAGTLPIARVEVTRETLPELDGNPDVLAILPNQAVSLIGPTRTVYEQPTKRELKNKITWGLEALDVPDLWEKTKGRDITVAVLDTGVHDEHDALKNKVKEFRAFDPLGRAIAATPRFDGGQHGTHVCGTVAGGTSPDGVAIGVAPDATLICGGVLVGDATLLTLVAGMSWAIENGADIISMSLGLTYFEPQFDAILSAIVDLYGVLPVIAIGNENHGNLSSPGSSPRAFSVGAAERRRGRLEIASFSSGASLEFPGSADFPLVTKPDIVAPGVGVYSCIPPSKVPGGSFEYTYMDGTSMATPHVSGVAALLMAAKPDAPAKAIGAALKETARHPGGVNRRPDNRWGYGMIRPMDALKALQ